MLQSFLQKSLLYDVMHYLIDKFANDAHNTLFIPYKVAITYVQNFKETFSICIIHMNLIDLFMIY